MYYISPEDNDKLHSCFKADSRFSNVVRDGGPLKMMSKDGKEEVFIAHYLSVPEAGKVVRFWSKKDDRSVLTDVII